MGPHRIILLLLSLVLVGGSLGWTATYGLHLRSDSHRRQVEAELTDFFELPCDVGRIRGHTFSSRSFEEVHLWLPDRRDRVFYCKQALWHELQRDGREAHELELVDGVLVLGTDRWNRGDYRHVLASGLEHDFERLNLDHVGMERFEILFDRGGFRVRCRETTGIIDMSNPSDGMANLTAYELNGQRISEGVRIHARFLPTQAIVVSQIVLSLPEIPLSILGMSVPAVGRIESGRFAGKVEYRTGPPTPAIMVSGDLKDADLSEWTASQAWGPFKAKLSVKVDQGRIESGHLSQLSGSGQVTALSLNEFAPVLGRKSLSGTANLRVDRLEIEGSQVQRLAVVGDASGLSVDQWLTTLGRGTATGDLYVRINGLDMVGEQIRSADIELKLLPPKHRPGTIDRTLILEAAQRLLQFSWPAALPQEILPEKVEYVECGIRLLVRDNKLRILGTHGPRGETILTINVFGQPFGVVREQSGEVDIGPWLMETLRRVRSSPSEKLRNWWERGGVDK